MAHRPELRLFIYDIADDRRRRKVAERLEESAVRVQESAFEVRLAPAETLTLLRELYAFAAATDSIRLYTIPDRALHKCSAQGGAEIADGGRYWLL